MATGRMLQKRISNSRKMSLLSSDGARLLYTWMLAHLDSNGCFYADPVMVNNIVLTRLGKTPKEVSKYLDELEETGAIIRYDVDGESYLQYPDFLDKQTGLRPDRECKSDIPKPSPDVIRNVTGCYPPKAEEEAEDKAEEKGSSATGCQHTEIVRIYHETLPELPAVVELTQSRRSLLRARWKEKKERQDLGWWSQYFVSVRESDFLMGRTNGNNGRQPFMADFEWLIRPQNMIKVIEGRYRNREGSQGVDWSKL